MRTLNVKKTTKGLIQHKWKTPLPLMWDDVLYMRCNAKGVINWDMAPVYNLEELKKRGNYHVHE